MDNDKTHKEKSVAFMEEARGDTGRETGAGTTAPLKNYLVTIKSWQPHSGHSGISVVSVSNLILTPQSAQM